MFHEYALEPAVLSTWDRARFFLDAFGPWKGRFLAEYPRRWKKMVYDGLTCPDVEKKRIVERLSGLDPRVFSCRPNAQYEGSLPWIENAVAEHARRPFRAIVAASGPTKVPMVDAEDVDDRQELWHVDVGRLVQREPAVFVQALRLLLEASRRIVIIDPYFRADQDDKIRPLLAFCAAVVGAASVEVHYADEARGYDPCTKDAARVLPKVLPSGRSVTLRCWKERPGGRRLHNRYLLTEVGGVKFGDGIERGSAGHEDHLSILDEPSRSALWNEYVGPALAFDPAGAAQVFVGK